jgi:dihydroorotate dehydrogenase (NAD+) catalytic subunit
MTATETKGLYGHNGPSESAVDMSTSLGTVPIPSPVLTASGCSAFGGELEPFVDLTAIGAVVTKSVQLRPRSGRPTPRMAETPSGMLNSIGLQGPGIDGLLAEELPWLAERGARALVSIAGTRIEDFAELAERLRGVPGVVGLEVNISCPNVESRGEVFACDPVAAHDVIAAVRAAADPAHPVYAKLSPDVTDIVSVARSCVAAGADGLSMINTLLGLVIDPDTMRPVLGGITGGLSGPAIRPVALRCVWQVHAAMPEVPILGMGGIRTGGSPTRSPRGGRCASGSTRTGNCFSTGAPVTTSTGCAGSPTRSSRPWPARSPSSSRRWPSTSDSAPAGSRSWRRPSPASALRARSCCWTPSGATSARRWPPTPTTCAATTPCGSTP